MCTVTKDVNGPAKPQTEAEATHVGEQLIVYELL